MRVTRRRFLARAGAAAVALPAAMRWGAGRAPEFAPAIGVCGSAQDAALWREGGAEYLEIGCGGELAPQRPLEEMEPALERLRAAQPPPRAANGFLPGSLRCVGPKADHAAVLAYAEQAFARAARVGVGTITFGSAAARALPEGWPRADADLQFAALLARLGDRAAAHGVDLCVENLQAAECNYLNLLSDARRVVAAVGHPRVGLTADVFHMLRMEEGPEAIREAGALVRHVHLAEKRQRTPPGADGDDFRPWLQALKDAGYAGRISLECGWADARAQLPKAIASLRAQIASLS